MPFARYDKNTMEPFAISVIAHSFSSVYSEYIQPTDTDNFDFISPDGLHALEVVSVIPKNEINAYEYEAQLSKGKKNLKLDKVEWAKVNEDGSLSSYYGGSLRSTIEMIMGAVKKKCAKAKGRKNFCQYESIDLCVCVQDGSLMDLHSYQIADFDFADIVFNNIFFITPSYFFRYTKQFGFEEYPRVVS